MVFVAKLLAFIAFAIAVNIPFGSYRNLTRKFSIPWWLAIHLPIPFVVYFRGLMLGLPGIRFATFLTLNTSLALAVSLPPSVYGQILGRKMALFGHRKEPVIEPVDETTGSLPATEVGVKAES